MTTLAVSKKKSSKEIAPSSRSLELRAEIVEATLLSPGNLEAAKIDKVPYTLADLRPGKLILVEFSRPGGSQKSAEEGEEKAVVLKGLTDGEKRKSKHVNEQIEKMTLKVVNMGYAKMVAQFAHNPFGFYCRNDEVDAVYNTIAEVQKCAWMVNDLAKKMNSPRRVRIDVYPMNWDHKDKMIRERIGEMIAEKLIDLRDAYTTKVMWNYRVRFDKAKNIERLLVPGEQADLVRRALESTQEQRKVMIAIYGEKFPLDWLDPRTGRLKEEIRLDFTAINRAIKHFCPSWEPDTAPAF